MQNKRPHPALSFMNAQKRSVKLRGEYVPVWMAPDIDKLLNDFIETNETEGEKLGQQRCPFGAVLWPSARALWEWLNESQERWEKVARQKDDSAVHAIELGSGVGFFAALLAAQTRWSMVATDYEPAYEDYLHANCKLQGAKPIPFLTLDWCEPTPAHMQNKFDLVIACDVFYDDSHLESVPRIAKDLLKPEGTLLLADPERFRFQTALEKLRAHFESVQIFTTSVENSPEDALKSGVVNPSKPRTSVQIVHCQKPLTP